jgi:hypothetical protein
MLLSMESIGSEDWQVLVSLFPPEWQDEAVRSGAVERLRGFESAEALLRMFPATKEAGSQTVNWPLCLAQTPYGPKAAPL